MDKRILVIDNDEKDRQSLGRWLTLLGYQPFLAATIEEARQLLEDNYFHALTIDMRMQDDTNPDDYSGFRIITDPAYETIPKIISTSYKESAFKDEWGSEITNRTDVFFMGKTDSWEKRRAILQRVFANVKDDFLLHLHFSSPEIVSFLHLVALVVKQHQANNFSSIDALIIEAIFRRLFHGTSQVTIDRLIHTDEETITLRVFTYTDNSIVVPMPYIVIIGLKNAVIEEAKRFPGSVLQGINSGTHLSNQSSVESIKGYAGIAYPFTAHDTENIRSLSRYIAEEQHITYIQAALEYLVSGQLKRVHQRNYTSESGETLINFYKNHLQVIGGEELLQKLLDNIHALCLKLNATGIAQLQLDANALSFIKNTGKSITVKLPDALLPTLANSSQVRWNLAHGELTVEKIIVTSAQEAYMIGFAKSAVAPQPHDFACLELSLRRHGWHLPDLAYLFDIEEMLEAPQQEDTRVKQRIDSLAMFHKFFETVKYLRHLAYTQIGCDPSQYRLCLRYLALIEFIRFEPHIYYTRHELQWYLHTLLLAVGLIDTKTQRDEMMLDVNIQENAVNVNGNWFRLSRTDFRFFYCLWQRAGQVCTFGDIETYIRQSFETDEATLNNDYAYLLSDFRRNIHTIVNRVRKELGFEKDWPIENVRGIGYKLTFFQAPEE